MIKLNDNAVTEGKWVSVSKMDSKVLDSIIMKMLKTVDGSKDEVFQIGEQSRQQYEGLVEEPETD